VRGTSCGLIFGPRYGGARQPTLRIAGAAVPRRGDHHRRRHAGPGYFYRSANGGKTWAEIAVSGTSGGVSLSSLSYVSPTVGWVVVNQPGFSGPDQLLRTSDAGRTWHPVRF
jgi:hypothetical protein